MGLDRELRSKFESELSLGDEFIPKMQGKIFVGAAESGDEMVLEGTDSTFSSISSMDARWY